MSKARRALLLATLLLSSCSGGDESQSQPEPTTPPAPTVPVGTVEGVVRLAEGSEIPTYAESPFATRAADQIPATCTAPQMSDRQPLEPAADRGLPNVAIAAMGDPTHWVPLGDPVTHEVHIHDCRVGPRTITATRGDRLRVVNELDYPFMPQFGMGFLQVVLPAEPLEHVLEVAGVQSLTCAFAAPCGRAEIMVFQTPVHTVSGAGGTFRIENAPAGQELTIVAYHPLLREARVTTRVEAGGTSHVELVLQSTPDTSRQPPAIGFDPGAPRDHAPSPPPSPAPSPAPSEPAPSEPPPSTTPAPSPTTPSGPASS